MIYPDAMTSLSPFTQGYVEALFEELNGHATGEGLEPYSFSDLAPETMARIIADCEAFSAVHVAQGFSNNRAGRWFWNARAEGWHDALGKFEDFPPLTTQLSGGKVRFA